MMFRAKLVSIGAMVVLLAGHVPAVSSTYYRVVQSGRSIEVTPTGSINPDCSSLGRVSINLIEAPRGGEVRVGEGRRFLSFGPFNPRSACNHRRLPASIIIYQSHLGFVGRDSFVVEVIAPDGLAQRSRLYVDVR